MYTSRERINEWLRNTGWIDDTVLVDGFEDAFVGMTEVFNRPPLATYDRGKCIEMIMASEKVDVYEAVDIFDYNIAGNWVGDNTPVFITLMRDPE